MVLAPRTFLNMTLRFTNCSLNLVVQVRVVVVVIFSVVVAVVVVAEGVSKFLLILDLVIFKLACFETYPSFLSYRPKYTAKATTQGDGNILEVR